MYQECLLSLYNRNMHTLATRSLISGQRVFLIRSESIQRPMPIDKQRPPLCDFLILLDDRHQCLLILP